MSKKNRSIKNAPKTDANKSVMQSKIKKFFSGQTGFLFFMLAIPIINWLVFWLYVNLNSILLAFQRASGGWTLDNFVHFWQSLTIEGNEMNISVRNTFLYFSSNLLIIMPIALMISYFLFKRIKGYKVFRIIFYLPCILSPVVLTTVFKQTIKPWGPVGVLAQELGFDYPASGLLGQASTATLTIIIYTILVGFGSNMLIFSGAMSRIPNEVLESAKLEGCGPFREIISIILPLIWPTISSAIVLAMTGLFTASGPVLLLVDGFNETSTISYWIFNKVNGNGYGGGGQYNLVSAAGLCFTAVAIPVILFVRWIMDKVTDAEY